MAELRDFSVGMTVAAGVCFFRPGFMTKRARSVVLGEGLGCRRSVFGNVAFAAILFPVAGDAFETESPCMPLVAEGYPLPRFMRGLVVHRRRFSGIGMEDPHDIGRVGEVDRG